MDFDIKESLGVNILDLVDPWLQVSVFEDSRGHGRMAGRRTRAYVGARHTFGLLRNRGVAAITGTTPERHNPSGRQELALSLLGLPPSCGLLFFSLGAPVDVYGQCLVRCRSVIVFSGKE